MGLRAVETMTASDMIPLFLLGDTSGHVVAAAPGVDVAVTSASMLLRCGGFREVRFVFCGHGCVEGLTQVGQLGAVGDWPAVLAQEHCPAASGAAWLALDRRRAHLGAGFADRLRSEEHTSELQSRR